MRHDEARTILGVSVMDQPEAVASAYKRLVFDVHPDRNPGDRDAGEKVARLTEAYAVLRGVGRAHGGGPYSRWRPDASGFDFSGSSGAEGRTASSVMDDLFREVSSVLGENKAGFIALGIALGIMGAAEVLAKPRRTT